MKKSLTLITTAALAFSLFASTAMADTAKTTSDYKDLTGIDAGLKSKIDLLLSKGIFEGVSNNDFGISQNMTRAQFAKVAALVFALKVDSTLKISSFSDVKADDSANGWAIPYVEAAKKAGLIDGMTDTTFAPGENVTIGQLDTVFVKGLGKTINTASRPWYTDAVKQATALGIHSAEKGGDFSATRADLVTGAYGTLTAYQNPVSVTPVQDSFAIGTSAPSGKDNINYSIKDSYDLSNVIDSGLTASTDGNYGRVTRAEAENPLYSKFAKEITFKATTTSGEEVVLRGIIQSITSSNQGIVKTAVSSDHKGFVLGVKAGTTTLAVVYSNLSGEIKQISIPINVKSESVAAQQIEARKSPINEYVTVTGNVYKGQFNAYDKMDLKVTDNYGVIYEQGEAQGYNFALGTIFIAEDISGDASNGTVGNVTIDTYGTVHITGNVTRFTLTALLPNGKLTSSDVVISKE